MAFKSLMIFALVASVGRVVAAPLAGGHLGVSNPCQGIWCARHAIGNRHPDVTRRLAEFDGPNVTLSSGGPEEPTAVDPPATPADPSSITLPLGPSSTPSIDPSSTVSVDPSSTSSIDDSVAGTPNPAESTGGGGIKPPSSTSDGIPQATEPAAGGPVTITLTSTVFLSPTDPAGSLPTKSPVSGVPLFPTLSVEPSSIVPEDSVTSTPTLIKPTGIFTSVPSLAPSVSPPNDSSVKGPSSNSNPTATPSPTVIELSNGVPSSSVSSSAPGQPTPTPTPTPTPGVIFLPPPDDESNP